MVGKPVTLEQDRFKQVVIREARVVTSLPFSETSGSAACSTNPTCSFSSGTNNRGHSLMGSKGLQWLTLHNSILNLAETVSTSPSSPFPQDLTPPGYF